MTPMSADDLDAFKELLTKANLYKPATETDKASHSDVTLSRFLRARQGNIHGAVKQFSDTHAWREKHDVDNLYRTFPEDEYHSAKRFYPRWTGRRDKDGHPVYIYHIASIGPLYDELHAVPPPRRYQRIVALYESMVNLVSPLCSHISPSGEPISSCTTIVDLAGLTLSTAFSFRGHLQESSKLATANYPETLHRIAVVNAPSFFSTIWRWIKGWFDEGTRTKIFILDKDMTPLKDIMHESDLPKQYGGTLEWEFEDEPAFDDGVKGALDQVGFPKGPAVFEDGKVQLAKES